MRARFKGPFVSLWTTIALALALLVAIYLVWALLRAEDFQ